MGLFSFHTADTNRSICCDSSRYKTFSVYLVGNVEYPSTGKKIHQEDKYQGYGVFGGVDFYVLFGIMNGMEYDTEKHDSFRSSAIDVYYSSSYGSGHLYPQLVEDPDYLVDFSVKPEDCENQGYFYDDDEDWSMLEKGYVLSDWDLKEDEPVFRIKLDSVCGKTKYRACKSFVMRKQQLRKIINSKIVDIPDDFDDLDNWWEIKE